MIQELYYYRVTCDKEGCTAYINVAAASRADLSKDLKNYKWSVGWETDWDTHLTLCPNHTEALK